MSSPIDKASSGHGGDVSGASAASESSSPRTAAAMTSSRDSVLRTRKGSSTSLSSLPSRMTQPPPIKPITAQVQLDISSASAAPSIPASMPGVGSALHGAASAPSSALGQSDSGHTNTPSSLAAGSLRAKVAGPFPASAASATASTTTSTAVSANAPTGSQQRSASPSSSPAAALASASKAGARTSVVDSSELWRTSAAKRAEKAWAQQSEKALYSDSKFKKYLALVDRTLLTFDSVSEWADFISFLGRLLKAFQSYPNYNVIPRKLIVAKRLAQCLNPALPSGVHQRALDVYHHIFGVIGADGLRRDLHVWTSGLLPFFQYASTSVKPTLLVIYEQYYLPLQEDLRPLAKALQLALLPGLEEETGEFFERTLRLFDRISDAVFQPFFLQCLWLTLITSPSVRLAAMNYLARRMPPIESDPDPTRLVGVDLGLMVRGLAQALQDDDLLVRRNALEILVTHLRQDAPVFQRFIKKPDRVLLVRASLNVVLRKDLSLNRRLYSWLLGSDEAPEAQVKFLRTHGLELVRSALKHGFEADTDEHAERQNPYRIFVSLLDKWEIGQPLTRVLALDAFQAIATRVARGQEEEELMTTAKMLFEVVDPFLLYGCFLQAIESQLSGAAPNQSHGDPEAGSDSAISLLCFVFKAFHIHDEETKQIHVPLLFSATAELLCRCLDRMQDQRTTSSSEWVSLLDGLELLKLLITVMPSRVFVRIRDEIQSEGNASKDSAATAVTSGLTSDPQASDDAKDAPSSGTHSNDFLKRAQHFYASSETDSQQAVGNFFGFQDRESCTALVTLLSKSVLLAAGRVKSSGQTSLQDDKAACKELFVRFLDVFADAVRVIDGSEAPEEIGAVASQQSLSSSKLSWDARTFAHHLLPHLDAATSFAEVERIVEVLLSCTICRALETPLSLDARPVLDRLVTKLLRYLEPGMSPYHVRAVELLWASHKITRRCRLETSLCQQLEAGIEGDRTRALVAFGTFWRLSEDTCTDEMRGPLLQVLDRLRSPDFEERQRAEAWLRSNMRSYAKVVDPLLHVLLQNRPEVQSSTLDLQHGLQVNRNRFVEPFDQQQVLYALHTLLSLSRFGGHGFCRALATTPLSSSLSIRTRLFIRQKIVDGNSSFLDVLLDECSRWLTLYPSKELRTATEESAIALRAAAVDLVQTVTQRGAASRSKLERFEAHLIEALLISIHGGSTGIQNKLLHTLHTVLSARASQHSNPVDRLQRRSSTTSQLHELPGRSNEDSIGPAEGSAIVTAASRAQTSSAVSHSSASASGSMNAGSSTLRPHPLLLATLQRGFSTPSNRVVLQHWSDFVLTTLSYYRRSAASLLLPLNETLCQLVDRALVEVSASYMPSANRPTFGAELMVQPHDGECPILESDLTLLINLAERTLMQAADAGADTTGPGRDTFKEPTLPYPVALADRVDGDGKPGQESAGNGGGGTGLLGYVSNVFSSDGNGAAERNDTIGEGRSRSLRTTVAMLHRVWTSCGSELPNVDARSLSLDNMMAKIKLRCRRALERIYRAHSAETIESLVDCWSRAVRTQRMRDRGSSSGGVVGGERSVRTVFEILNTITPSTQIVVTFLCDVLGNRTSRSDSERSRRGGSMSVSDATLFAFLDAVLARMDGAEALQVWPVTVVFVKDFVANALSRKLYVYPVLRIVTTLAEKLSTTTALDDRRIRRDLQDSYVKLLDSCILIAGRSFDQSTWIRRSGKDSLENLDADAGGFAAELWDEKAGTVPGASVAENGGSGGSSLIDAINHFIAGRALAACRKMQLDADRTTTLVANAVYYIVAPASRSRSRNLEVDASVLEVISEVVRMPGAVKAWRSSVGELFGDSRFFSMSISSAEHWRPVVLALMTQDKERLPELLVRITASAATANIFANRELEMLSKALNLRRLSFTIFAGELDAFLTQLPAIQERVVDLLRSNVSEVVHAEFYLCMRVLLVRFSGRHLSSFWPVLMTELMRLYDSAGTSEAELFDSRDGCQLLLSTLKLLDLLVLLQPEDFQIHEWLFITDTIDAVYPSDDFQGDTMLDQLSAALVKSSGASMKGSQTLSNPFSLDNGLDGQLKEDKRKLQLGHIRSIESLRELVPFLHSVSQQAFESNYRDLPIDWQQIESSLLADMFDAVDGKEVQS
ncbi:hypothetical protein BCV70DRAFT_199555 [Testicularia cyperi]|uniref:Uncharacterized protein n=1 Tax=Testicularia cyperi TaxID=1882483 RepID=A0A317XSB4_9BASI|nr:hypothetical protein BCV70DRAFT_199555 [Testicularia cyperi]